SGPGGLESGAHALERLRRAGTDRPIRAPALPTFRASEPTGYLLITDYRLLITDRQPRNRPMDSALALQEFLRPPPPLRNLKREEAILERAEVTRLKIVPGTENDIEEVAVYRWGKADRRILLVHGWGGKAAQFFSFVGPLLEAGFEVIAFDAPAHGASSGSFASGPAFARAARAVAGDAVYGIIAHSLGAAGSAIALAQGLKANRVVFLAPAALIGSLLEEFIRLRQIPEPVAAELRQRFAARYLAEVVSVPLMASRFDAPVLIFHDPEDRDLPFSHGEAIAAAWPGAELIATSRAGHWRIMRDQSVIERTIRFLI
ncbi:MAG: alpha/beta fold hydrolase, partial [Chthoniobacterales bacterium]